jgi:hypothetical protein
MNDKTMIEALRNYARAYSSDKPYGLNPGLALMIANRMEQLVSIVNKDNYRSQLSKEALQYNIKYHIENNCATKEDCIKCVETLLGNFEEK